MWFLDLMNRVAGLDIVAVDTIMILLTVSLTEMRIQQPSDRWFSGGGGDPIPAVLVAGRLNSSLMGMVHQHNRSIKQTAEILPGFTRKAAGRIGWIHPSGRRVGRHFGHFASQGWQRTDRYSRRWRSYYQTNGNITLGTISQMVIDQAPWLSQEARRQMRSTFPAVPSPLIPPTAIGIILPEFMEPE